MSVQFFCVNNSVKNLILLSSNYKIKSNFKLYSFIQHRTIYFNINIKTKVNCISFNFISIVVKFNKKIFL